MSFRYSQHDDRVDTEDKPMKSNHGGGGSRYDRKEDRPQGRPPIGDRLTYPSSRDVDNSTRPNRSSRDAPPEAARSNKNHLVERDNRVERDDFDDRSRKKNEEGSEIGRIWERPEGGGSWERNDGWGRGRGGGRGARPGSSGEERRSRRDGHDDRDEHDYTTTENGRPRGSKDDNGGWDERGAVPGGGRLSRAMEARLGAGEPHGGSGGSGAHRDGWGSEGGGGGSRRYRSEHDDREGDGGAGGGYRSGGSGYSRGGRGFSRGGSGAGRGRVWSEHDDRVEDFGYGSGTRSRYRGEHDDRDAAGDEGAGGGYGGSRGRGRGGRASEDLAGCGYGRNASEASGGGRGWGRGGGRRSFTEIDGSNGRARNGRDRERSRSPAGRWGHDKFESLPQEDVEDGGGGGQQQLGRRRPGGARGQRFGGSGFEEGVGDLALGAGPTGKLDDELMAEAAETAAYDELVE